MIKNDEELKQFEDWVFKLERAIENAQDAGNRAFQEGWITDLQVNALRTRIEVFKADIKKYQVKEEIEREQSL